MVLLSLVIFFSADVGMLARQGGFFPFWKKGVFLVQSVFQNGLNTFVEEALDRDGIGAGGFEAFFGIDLSQTENTQAGAETLLGMRFIFQDMGHQFFGVRADLVRPADHSFGGPFQIFLMSRGHVLFEGGEGAFAVTAGVAGHPAVFEQNFHGLGG